MQKKSGYRHHGYEPFTRLPADSTDPAGNSVLANCHGTFKDATASFRVRDVAIGSQVTIRIQDARPDTLYTFWLRLQGTDSSGEGFGGSPLTGGGSTPLAASWSLPDLLAATGEGNGMLDVANGVTTDSNGNARFRVQLDFPFEGGAYPFQRMEKFNADDPRFPESDVGPRIFPVSIVDPREPNIDAPFLIRMVSHCTDELGHGLTPNAREPWFDFPE